MTDQKATPGEAGPEEGLDSPEPELREALSQSEATAQENWNKYLRAAAELDNVRKRAARDVEQARKFGVERLAGELLSVLDSLEMGLEAGATATPEALLEGKKATLRLLKTALERFGVVELSPAGEQFDPQLHEALAIQPASNVEPGSVVAVVQKGYQLNGRLLRPARVIVAAANAEPDAGRAEDASGDAA